MERRKWDVKSSCWFLILFASFLNLFLPVNCSATEMGGGAYPNGAEGFMAGTVPPPGTYIVNYLTHYSADEFLDDNGNVLIPNFNLDVTANVIRIIHISKKQVLGGYWGMHLFIPLLKMDVSVPGLSHESTGLGDIIVDPFILSWHSKNWHFATGLDIYVPTGKYNKANLANLGRNYWTIEPIFGVTYLSDNGWDISGKFMCDFNTKNEDTDYQSGQEFHFDYTIAKRVNNFALGLGGYYYQQITNDEQNGVKVGDGFKGRVFAWGPQIKYDSGRKSFILKYQKETGAEYRPEGEKLWLNFIYAF